MTIQRIADYPMPKRTSYMTNRTNWKLDPDRAVLLIHDMQRYFLQFYDMDGPLVSTLLHNLSRLREWAQQNAVPIVYTAQPHEQTVADRALLNDMWGPGLTAADPEQQHIIDQLSPENGDTVLTKWRYSAFKRSDLYERMQSWNRDQLVIGGIYAHIGCMITAVDAFMSDVQPFLIGDAVADFSLEEHQLALKYVATRCGHVLDTDSLAESGATTVTQQWLHVWVRKLVEEEDADLDPDENLIIYGLDSLRIMQLSSELKGRGINVSFEELGRTPTLSNWWSLVESRQRAV
jgi:bifunctional isochorismate lyase/aryl carrier protein